MSVTTMDKLVGVGDSVSIDKGNPFKPSAPQNIAPPRPVIVPWQKKK